VVVYIFLLSHFIDVIMFAWVMAAVYAICAFALWKWLSGPGAGKMIDLQ